ncbi:DUF6382 domain-containing protein [Paenibacillus sp. CF384]|uniref:DUF6382 domain-containing protein n=1 Tax=Paenibacillus sp. CF384 TaxID=1884382 RepID=UPI00089520D8|nr:DUF6382 domain-containing protein [Paenibacillus sp. CF384]SDW45788.1 Forkhead associated (FHA) domain, binds pSer, pThr, pTyr [Paenibacillus sp. CF384]
MVIKELRVDFTMKHGLEMIVDLESGISREQLDPIEMKMLHSQRIPKLLAVEWVDIDGKITLRYRINGKRILLHRMQTQPLTMIQFYALLLAIVETLDDCKQYMLREEGFMLHEQYIYIGEHWEDVELVYVPLQDTSIVSSASEAVLAMAIRWVGYIVEPDGVGLQHIFQHLRGECEAWGQLRRSLLALLGNEYRESTNESPGKPDHAIKPVDKVAAPLSTQSSFVWKNESVPPRAPSAVRREEGSDLNQQDRGVELPLTELPVQEQPTSLKKTGWILGAGGLIIAALIWRFLYLPSPSQSNLLICCGLTLMTAAGGLIVNRRMSSGTSKEEEGIGWNERQAWPVEDGFVPNSMPIHVQRQLKSYQEEFIEDNVQPAVQSNAIAFTPLSHSGQTASPESLPNDATVLLNQNPESPSGAAKRAPYLERMVEGESTVIVRLEQSQFVIGRVSEGVDHVDVSSGISRAHLEVSVKQGSWSVKDMGSRNGSTLNGVTMIPYKAYPLNDHDSIQLAGDSGPRYKFRSGVPSSPAQQAG